MTKQKLLAGLVVEGALMLVVAILLPLNGVPPLSYAASLLVAVVLVLGVTFFVYLSPHAFEWAARIVVVVGMVLGVWLERSLMGGLVIYLLGVGAFTLMVAVVYAAVFKWTRLGTALFLPLLKLMLHTAAFMFLKNRATKGESYNELIRSLGKDMIARLSDFKEGKSRVPEVA